MDLSPDPDPKDSTEKRFWTELWIQSGLIIYKDKQIRIGFAVLTKMY